MKILVEWVGTGNPGQIVQYFSKKSIFEAEG